MASDSSVLSFEAFPSLAIKVFTSSGVAGDPRFSPLSSKESANTSPFGFRITQKGSLHFRLYIYSSALVHQDFQGFSYLLFPERLHRL